MSPAKLMNARILKLADQVDELRAFISGVGNRDKHNEQFIQAGSQQFGQAGGDCGGVAKDNQIVDEVVGHSTVGGDREAGVGEHAGVEGQTAVTSNLLAGCCQDGLSILAERYGNMGNERRCRASTLRGTSL